jgi:flagellar hook-length control protein FliK
MMMIKPPTTLMPSPSSSFSDSLSSPLLNGLIPHTSEAAKSLFTGKGVTQQAFPKPDQSFETALKHFALQLSTPTTPSLATPTLESAPQDLIPTEASPVDGVPNEEDSSLLESVIEAGASFLTPLAEAFVAASPLAFATPWVTPLMEQATDAVVERVVPAVENAVASFVQEDVAPPTEAHTATRGKVPLEGFSPKPSTLAVEANAMLPTTPITAQAQVPSLSKNISTTALASNATPEGVQLTDALLKEMELSPKAMPLDLATESSPPHMPVETKATTGFIMDIPQPLINEGDRLNLALTPSVEQATPLQQGDAPQPLINEGDRLNLASAPSVEQATPLQQGDAPQPLIDEGDALSLESTPSVTEASPQQEGDAPENDRNPSLTFPPEQVDFERTPSTTLPLQEFNTAGLNLSPTIATTPTNGLNPNSPVGQAVFQQVSEGLEAAYNSETRTMQLNLNPEELGSIRVQLRQVGEGQIAARLIADNPETADILQQQANSLKDKLEQQGLTVTRIEVIQAGATTITQASREGGHQPSGNSPQDASHNNQSAFGQNPSNQQNYTGQDSPQEHTPLESLFRGEIASANTLLEAQEQQRLLQELNSLRQASERYTNPTRTGVNSTSRTGNPETLNTTTGVNILA